MTSIVGYMYRADLYCPECIAKSWGRGGADAEDVLDDSARFVGIDRSDESSFDSGDFPKVVVSGQTQAEDVCGSCGEALE